MNTDKSIINPMMYADYEDEVEICCADKSNVKYSLKIPAQKDCKKLNFDLFNKIVGKYAGEVFTLGEKNYYLKWVKKPDVEKQFHCILNEMSQILNSVYHCNFLGEFYFDYIAFTYCMTLREDQRSKELEGVIEKHKNVFLSHILKKSISEITSAERTMFAINMTHCNFPVYKYDEEIAYYKDLTTLLENCCDNTDKIKLCILYSEELSHICQYVDYPYPYGIINTATPLIEFAVYQGFIEKDINKTPCSTALKVNLYIDNQTQTIGEYQYSMIANKTITIPENIKTIEEGAFYECVFLSNVNFKEGSAIEIGTKAFKSSNIYSIIIPNSTKTIHTEAFADCMNLDFVVISESVEMIEDKAFANCNNLKKVVILGDKTKISESAFDGCHESIEINYYCLTNTATTTYELDSETSDNSPEYEDSTEENILDVISSPYQLKQKTTECPYCNKTLTRKNCIYMHKKSMYEVTLLYCSECKCYYINYHVTTNIIRGGTPKPAKVVTNIIKSQDKTGFVTLPYIPQSIFIHNSSGERLNSYQLIYGEEKLEIKIKPMYQYLISNVKINGEIISIPFTIEAQNLHSIDLDSTECYKVRFNYISGGINVYTDNNGYHKKITSSDMVKRGTVIYIEKDPTYTEKSSKKLENLFVNGENVTLPHTHCVTGVVNISATYTNTPKSSNVSEQISPTKHVTQSYHLKITCDKIKVYRNGLPLESGSTIKTGELLSVQYIKRSTSQKAVLLCNGEKFTTPHVITVGVSDIVLEYFSMNDTLSQKPINTFASPNQTHEQMQLNESSFLGRLGYSTSLSATQRYEILRSAVRLHGKNKVINFLEFLINGKLAQENGASKYHNAISIWSYDIERVRNM